MRPVTLDHRTLPSPHRRGNRTGGGPGQPAARGISQGGPPPRTILRSRAIRPRIILRRREILRRQARPGPWSQHYSSNEVLDAGHRFFGSVSRGLAQLVERPGANGACPMVMCSARKPAARWSPDCATAKGSSTPRMPATSGSSGKVLRSAGISVAKAHAR